MLDAGRELLWLWRKLEALSYLTARKESSRLRVAPESPCSCSVAVACLLQGLSHGEESAQGWGHGAPKVITCFPGRVEDGPFKDLCYLLVPSKSMWRVSI